MPIQDRLTQVAIAKQVAIGTPAASGTAGLQIGVKGGTVASIDVTQDDFGATWGSRLSEGHDRGNMTPGAAFDAVGMPVSIGHFLQAALGAPNTTGSGPYTHVFTVSDTLPYYTIHARKGSEYFRVADTRLNELELSWEGTKALTAKTSWVGCGYDFLSGAYTAATNERPKDGSLKGAGGTFTIFGSNAVVRQGSIKVTNGVEAIHGSHQVMPANVFPKMTHITGTLNVVVDDLTAFRRHITGTANGTSPSATVFRGDAVCSWTDGTHTLTFALDDAVFATEFPDTSAEGGPVELQLAFEAVAGATTPMSFTLVNSTATY